MKRCDDCRFRNEPEYNKPCVVYRDDCPLYEKEGVYMTLLDVLKLISSEYFPLEMDSFGCLDTRPQSVFNVTICFMAEDETWLTCNIQNEILVPWYDCEVSSIQPDGYHNNSICVWLKDKEYLKEHYPQHISASEEGR